MFKLLMNRKKDTIFKVLNSLLKIVRNVLGGFIIHTVHYIGI